MWRDRGGAWAERFSGCKGGEEKKVKEPHGSTEMIKNRGEERAAGVLNHAKYTAWRRG